MTVLLAFMLAAAEPAAAPAVSSGALDEAFASINSQPAFAEDATAREMLEGVRAMLPQDVDVSGHINRRSRHGTEVAAYRYTLKRKGGETFLKLYDKAGKELEFEKGGRLLDTDVTWSDLATEYLWWDDVKFDETAESESLQGIVCRVLLVSDGDRSVRIWIDRRTGAMLQAQEMKSGKVVREMFATSIKKFGEKWSPKNIEVGPPGAKYRTKIVVEDVK